MIFSSSKYDRLECRSDEMYSIQNYVTKFVSDLRQVGGFLWVLWFSQQQQQNPRLYDITEKLWKVVLNTIIVALFDRSDAVKTKKSNCVEIVVDTTKLK